MPYNLCFDWLLVKHFPRRGLGKPALKSQVEAPAASVVCDTRRQMRAPNTATKIKQICAAKITAIRNG